MELKEGDIVRVRCDSGRTEEGAFFDEWERFKVEFTVKEDAGTVSELIWLGPVNPDAEPEVSICLKEDGQWVCWNSEDTLGFDPVPCEVEKENI